MNRTEPNRIAEQIAGFPRDDASWRVATQLTTSYQYRATLSNFPRGSSLRRLLPEWCSSNRPSSTQVFITMAKPGFDGSARDLNLRARAQQLDSRVWGVRDCYDWTSVRVRLTCISRFPLSCLCTFSKSFMIQVLFAEQWLLAGVTTHPRELLWGEPSHLSKVVIERQAAGGFLSSAKFSSDCLLHNTNRLRTSSHKYWRQQPPSCS